MVCLAGLRALIASALSVTAMMTLWRVLWELEVSRLPAVARLGTDGADLASADDAPRVHVERGHLDFRDRFGNTLRKRLCLDFPDYRA